MAYWIVKTNTYNNSKYFQCDFVSDIEDLPTYNSDGKPQEGDTISSYKCAPGSQCLCQEDGTIWLLGKDTCKWIKQNSGTISASGISYFSNEPDLLSDGMTWIGD